MVGNTDQMVVSAAPGPTRRPSRPRQRRRDLILEAAAELFAKRGFAATGIDEIGAAAGITGPGVYRHFASKDEILKTLVQGSVERLLTTDGPSPLELDEPPDVALRRLVSVLVVECLQRGPVAYVAWNETRNMSPDTRAWLTRLHRLRAAEWVHVLSRLRPDRTDLELMTMVNGVYGMVIEAVNHDVGLDPETTREVLETMVIDALQAGEPSERH
jgi:AcrR family transcriptional regulator